MTGGVHRFAAGAILLSLALAGAGRAQAQTHTVCSSGCDFTLIADAVAVAASGDVIELGAEVFTEYDVQVTVDLTIRGQGEAMTTWQATPAPQTSLTTRQVRAVGVGLTLTLEDMTLRHGNAPNGGAVEATNLIVRRCTFDSNRATSTGSATLNYGTLLIEESTFVDQIAGNGVVRHHGSGIGVITGSRFEGNTGSTQFGVYTSASGGLEISDTEFLDNVGATSGAYLIHSDGPLTIDACLIRRSRGGGGAVQALSQLSMTDTTVELTRYGSGVVAATGSVVSIERSTIRGNQDSGVYTGGSTTIVDSTIAGNAYSGIYCSGESGSLHVINSTVAGNTATGNGFGGGVRLGACPAVLDGTTVVGNQADSTGGGIYTSTGGVELRNTVVASNVAPIGPDCWGPLASLGFNLISSRDDCPIDSDQDNVYGVSPGLGPLVDNGGPTPTMLPLDGSPLIDRGSCLDSEGATVSFDQRGVARPIGGDCDIGAAESAGAPGSGSAFECWDVNENSTCDVGTEDHNGDGDCTTADCQGADGIACWDLDGDGVCTPGSEDFTSDNLCTVLDCRGASGSDGYSCWDLNQNHVCDVAENVDGLGGCNVDDCRGAAGNDGVDGADGADGMAGAPGADGYSCWDLDADYVCDAGENVNGDGDCTPADCTGPEGAGTACWDLNDNDTCDPGSEDPSGDGTCSVVDCRGETGAGLACWDLNENGICDPSEDQTGDVNCTVLDCRGASGADGADGADGAPGADGMDGTPGADGTAGSDGLSALVDVSDEPAGDNCALGGLRLASGLDDDGDGTLDEDEVDDVRYLCAAGAGAGGGDGGPGGGAGAGGEPLVEVEDQLPGDECEAGGKRVDSGFDRDGDGSLDRGEIIDTDYVCNGVPGERGPKSCGCRAPGAGRPRPAAVVLLLLVAARLRLRRARTRRSPC